MKRTQCQICSEYKIIFPHISRCPNAECSAFNCKDCLEKWYQEKRECPICHTKIGDIEENLEAVIVESHGQREQGSDTHDPDATFTCVCSVCSFHCYRIEIQTNGILEAFMRAIQFTCIFLFVGLLTFNVGMFMGSDSVTEGFAKTKHHYVHPTFYLMLISLGMVTCGSVIICIGCVGACLS